MTKFSIATNFDHTLLDEIEKLNKKYVSSEVVEVYGSLPASLMGSGRSPIGLPNISIDSLAKHIKQAHNVGLKFNYLMNAPGSEYLFRGGRQKQLHEFIRTLKKISIDYITIADELLIKYTRKHFKDIPIHVSLIAGIDTPKEAKKFSDLGVELITLNQHTINRDFKKIKEIVDTVNCKIRLYANISCLQDCPMRDKHYAWLASQSSTASKSLKNQKDPFILWCENRYIKNPVEFLQSPFIRPEGIKLYQETSIDSFKLSDRREPTSSLVELLEAYMDGKYYGNLYSLLFRNDRKWSNAIKNIINDESLGHTAISINNDKLSELDFDAKATTLNRHELSKFYELATNKAVSGILNKKTKIFHTKLHSS